MESLFDNVKESPTQVLSQEFCKTLRTLFLLTLVAVLCTDRKKEENRRCTF